VVERLQGLFWVRRAGALRPAWAIWEADDHNLGLKAPPSRREEEEEEAEAELEANGCFTAHGVGRDESGRKHVLAVRRALLLLLPALAATRQLGALAQLRSLLAQQPPRYGAALDDLITAADGASAAVLLTQLAAPPAPVPSAVDGDGLPFAAAWALIALRHPAEVARLVVATGSSALRAVAAAPVGRARRRFLCDRAFDVYGDRVLDLFGSRRSGGENAATLGWEARAAVAHAAFAGLPAPPAWALPAAPALSAALLKPLAEEALTAAAADGDVVAIQSRASELLRRFSASSQRGPGALTKALQLATPAAKELGTKVTAALAAAVAAAVDDSERSLPTGRDLWTLICAARDVHARARDGLAGAGDLGSAAAMLGRLHARCVPAAVGAPPAEVLRWVVARAETLPPAKAKKSVSKPATAGPAPTSQRGRRSGGAVPEESVLAGDGGALEAVEEEGAAEPWDSAAPAEPDRDATSDGED